jgi:transcriptional regulator with XRE-family HTH domain
MDVVGRRLLATRRGLGLTQAALVARVGPCTTTQWSNYERGDRMLDLDVADRLCHEFGFTLDWLYRGDPARVDIELMRKIRREEASLAA